MPASDLLDGGRRASQRDVAREANISQSTVSRVLTPGESVSSEIRARVLAVARKLDYHPNAIARSLVQGSTNMVGLVVTPFFNPWYALVIEHFTKILQARGYWTMLLNVTDQHSADETLPVALRYQLDAIIIASASLSSRLASELVRTGTPVVLFNRYVSGASVHTVCCDNIKGGRIVADYLVECGHRRFAFVSGGEDTSTDRDRETGFEKRLEERGCRLALRDQGDDTYDSGCSAARKFLNRDDPPDAIFCANDLMAMGVLDVVRKEFQAKVPEDISIVGFDDIAMASWSSYCLTTVRPHVSQMVTDAVEVVMNAIERPEQDLVVRHIPPVLVERASSRPRRSADSGMSSRTHGRKT